MVGSQLIGCASEIKTQEAELPPPFVELNQAIISLVD